MAELVDYLPPKKSERQSTLNCRMLAATKERLAHIAEELEISQTAVIHGLIDRQYDDMFEDD